MKQTAAFSTIKTIIYLVFPGLNTPWAAHHGPRPCLGHGPKNKKKELRKKEPSLGYGKRHGSSKVITDALGQNHNIQFMY